MATPIEVVVPTARQGDDRLTSAPGTSEESYTCPIAERNPALHGGYLLATPLPLIMAVVTRLPLPLVATGTPLPAAFHPVFNLSMVVVLSCVVALWRWQPRHPAPFVTIGAATLLEWVGYYFAPALPGWVAFGVAVAAAPTWLVGAIGFGMGTAAVWYGWTSPLRGRVIARTAEAQCLSLVGGCGCRYRPLA